jgi:hypothetical protein
MIDRVLPQRIIVGNALPQIVVGLSLQLDKDLTEAHLEAIARELVESSVVPKDSLALIHEALKQAAT